MPAIVDLAAMREAMTRLGGNADEINPLAPAELVIDHSVQVDSYGTAHSLADNNRIEFERNGERYAFLRWGQSAFRNFKVVPPNTGIVHQVNLEYLGRVVFENTEPRPAPGLPGHAGRHRLAHHHDQRPRRARLGRRRHRGRGRHARSARDHADPAGHRLQADRQPHSGRDRDRPGADGDRDAAQARRGGQVRRILRRRPGKSAAGRPRHDRQHVARIRQHLRDLSDRRRDAALSAAVGPLGGTHSAGRGLCARPGAVACRWREGCRTTPTCSNSTSSSVEPSLAGPSRPQDRVPLRIAKSTYRKHHTRMAEERARRNPAVAGTAPVSVDGRLLRTAATAPC